MPNILRRALRKLPAFLAALALVLAACHLGNETQVEDRVTFPSLYDSLNQYDSAVIIFLNSGGDVVDTVYKGPTKDPGLFRNLPVDNWDGGKVTIRIIGLTGGKEVYKVEKQYDGKTKTTDSTFVLIVPGATLTSPVLEFVLFEGDSLPLPDITVKPANLADKALLWSSSHPEIAALGATHLKGLARGTAQITVRLQSDESKTLVLKITVAANERIPETLTVSPETLKVAAAGAPARAEAKATPTSASAAVAWKTDDPAIATVDAQGLVRGVRKGGTWLRAASKERASVGDSAWVEVSDPVAVTAVSFTKDSTQLFLRGAAESLVVEVLPPEADPTVTLISLDSSKVSIQDGRISGLAAGATRIVATSRANPAKTDTLHVTVSEPIHVDSVRVTPRQVKLYVGGDPALLAGRVYPPSAPEALRWTSGNSAYAKVDAAGKLTAVAAGNLRVYAASAADSLQKDSVEVSVKVDAPVVTVGPDTVVSVGSWVAFLPVVAPQEYGVVTGFQWDLDGDLTWDSSAASVRTVTYKYDQEKEYTARFLVRDSEGNETLVSRKIKAMKGLIVQIISPANNSYSRTASIPVRWSVDGVEQDSLKTQPLADGPNTITRTARDAAGRTFSHSVTVILDSLAPNAPVVKGPELASQAFPTWTWSTGGSGGAGIFRHVLDHNDFSAAVETRDTSFLPSIALTEGLHTLSVQERDLAGNWSKAGLLIIRVDLTPPARPELTVEPGLVTNNPKPTFRWKGGGGGIGLFQIKLGSAEFGNPPAPLSFTPESNLPAGEHLFQVRERDSAGHWSAAASVTVTIDLTAPSAPKLTGSSPTSALPRWAWTSGGNGGSGDFRFKVGGDGNPANGGTETRDLEHVLTAGVTGTTYTLYLQERDAAGNWSAVANLPILYDQTRPTVSITAPQASGTFLTRSATVNVSGTSSKPAGGTPIQSITYTLDGVAGTLATNLQSSGAWSISSLPLPADKTVELKVTATDGTGNTGDAILRIERDATAPSAPTFATQPPATINASDTRSTLEWTWTQGSAAADSFVVRLNGTDVARQTGTSYSVGNLTDRTYALQVTALDRAGNAATPVAATVVTVDRTAPGAPSPSATSPTRDNTPTWSWSGTGPFEIRYARNAAPTGAGTAHTTTAFTPLSGLEDGTWQFQVRERDGAGNWSAWSSSASVVIKASAPAAPSLNRNASETNAPRWNWASGGGGNGTFRYRWSGAGSYLGEGTGTEYAPSNLAEQQHTLCVSERDVYDYGAESCSAIRVDRTAPVIAGYNVADGFITNQSSITIRYTKDGAAESFECGLVDGGSKVCEVTVSDLAGNPATVRRTIWHRSNVIFVKAGQTGTRGGTSWDDAYSQIGTAIQAISGRSGPVEIWVSQGEYPAFTVTRSTTSLYGGFSATGNPTSIDARNLASSVSRIRANADGGVITVSGEGNSTCREVLLDGFHVRSEEGQALAVLRSDNATFRNMWIEQNRNTIGAGLVAITSGSHTFDKVYIRDNYAPIYGSVYLYGGGGLSISNSEISYNTMDNMGWGSAGIFSEYGGNITIRSSRLVRNSGGMSNHQAFVHGSGSIDIAQCVIQGLREGVYPAEGEAVIWGSGNTSP